ncbi:MAG: hypothetical protein JNL11_00175 [Bdellovibrionaceae bacterium]|nr:hypothetical protein [Pseudobdellovibrionaceae bacterium]
MGQKRWREIGLASVSVITGNPLLPYLLVFVADLGTQFETGTYSKTKRLFKSNVLLDQNRALVVAATYIRWTVVIGFTGVIHEDVLDS